MAARAAVMSSTGIQDYSNRTIRRQDTFGMSTESSLDGGWVNMVSTHSEDIVLTPSEELMSTPSEEFGSTSASSGWVRVNNGIIGCVRSNVENRSTSGKAKLRSTYSIVFE
jgi:hypothetical protein